MVKTVGREPDSITKAFRKWASRPGRQRWSDTDKVWIDGKPATPAALLHDLEKKAKKT